MANTPQVHPVYVSLNRPLTIGGADRRLFFLALVMGGATFTFFGRLLAGILMFVALYVAARWMAQTSRNCCASSCDRPRPGRAMTRARPST
jgi:type IV secretory pathway TrbD component